MDKIERYREKGRLTFLRCWKRSKNEPSFVNTFAGLAFGGLGLDVVGVVEGPGEAYPL